MIISRTPLRVSFLGRDRLSAVVQRKSGGRDKRLNKQIFIYKCTTPTPVFLNINTASDIICRKEVNSLDEIKHPSVRECARFLSIRKRNRNRP